MKSQHNTKQLSSWPFVLALCLLIVIGTLIVKLWPRTVPFDQCSPLYEHYADVDGIDASFIKDFRVNDTVFVDVTLLEAKDSAGWDILCHDFAISDIIPLLQQINKDMIITQLVNKYDYTQVVDRSFSDPEMMAFSHTDKIITIFHIRSKDDISAIYHHNFDKSTQKYTH